MCYRVLITATNIECVPPKLVFFSNYEDGEFGKGLLYEKCDRHCKKSTTVIFWNGILPELNPLTKV